VRGWRSSERHVPGGDKGHEVCRSANRTQTVNSAVCPCEIGMTHSPRTPAAVKPRWPFRLRASHSRGRTPTDGLLQRGGCSSPQQPEWQLSVRLGDHRQDARQRARCAETGLSDNSEELPRFFTGRWPLNHVLFGGRIGVTFHAGRSPSRGARARSTAAASSTSLNGFLITIS
jgi:hypothetical protein